MLSPLDPQEVLTSHRSGSFQQTETITESHNWSQYREQMTMGYLDPTDASTTQVVHLRLRGHPGRGGEMSEESKDQKVCYKIVSSRCDRKAIPINSQ